MQRAPESRLPEQAGRTTVLSVFPSPTNKAFVVKLRRKLFQAVPEHAQSKEAHKSKSPGSNQVSFRKQMWREKGMSEEQGKSCDDVIQGKSLKATRLCYKQVAPEQSCTEKV